MFTDVTAVYSLILQYVCCDTGKSVWTAVDHSLQQKCAVNLIQPFCLADNLLFVINSIKQEIVNRVQVPKDDRGVNMEQKLNVLIKDTLGKH